MSDDPRREAIARALYEWAGPEIERPWDRMFEFGRSPWYSRADAVIAVLPPLPEDSHPEPTGKHQPGPSDDGVSYCEVCDYCWPCPTVAPTPSRPRRSGSGTP